MLKTPKNTKMEQIPTQTNKATKDDKSTNTVDKDDIRKSIASTNLDELIVRARAKDCPSVQFEAVQLVRKFLIQENSPAAKKLIANGILPILVGCLENDDHPKLQFEAAWALIGATLGTPEQISDVTNEGSVPQLIRLLDSPHYDVCENALWVLSNIIGGNTDTLYYVINIGIIKRLLALVKKDVPVSLLHTAAWTAANLCRNKDSNKLNRDTIQEILPLLSILIIHNDVNVLTDTIWALAYLIEFSYYGNETTTMVIKAGLVPRLTSLLSHNDDKVVLAALRTVGNIVTGTDLHTQVILNCNALAHFPKLLDCPRIEIVKEVTWVLSNIVAGTIPQIQAAIDAGLLQRIIYHLRTQDLKVQRNSARAASNIMQAGSKEQVMTLLQEGVIGPLCGLVQTCKENDILLIVLTGISHILKNKDLQGDQICSIINDCQGFEAIKLLKDHKNHGISKAALDIMEQYLARHISTLHVS